MDTFKYGILEKAVDEGLSEGVLVAVCCGGKQDLVQRNSWGLQIEGDGGVGKLKDVEHHDEAHTTQGGENDDGPRNSVGYGLML